MPVKSNLLTDCERRQKRKLALLDYERITLATEIPGKDEADIGDFPKPAFFVELFNLMYDLKGHKLTAEKLEAAVLRPCC